MKLRHYLVGTKDPIAYHGTWVLCLLVLITVFIEPFLSKPLEFLALAVVIVLAFGLMIRMIYLQFRPVEDEIELSHIRYGATVGFWIGGTIGTCLLLALLLMPGSFEFLLQLSERPSEAEILAKESFKDGFVYGWMAAIFPIILSMITVSVIRDYWTQTSQNK